MRRSKSLQQQSCQFCRRLLVLRRHVRKLTRIVLQVIQALITARRGLARLIAILARPLARTENIFPVFRLDIRFFVLQILAKNEVARLCNTPTFQIRPQTLTMLLGQGTQGQHVHNGRRHVHMLRQICHHAVANAPRDSA